MLVALLGLGLELGLADARASQFDVEDTLEGGEHFLVGLGSTPLEIGNDSRCGVALGSEVFLGHLGLHLGTLLLDGVAYVLADRFWFDDLVAAVDLGHALTLRAAFGLFHEQQHKMS